MSKEKYKPLMPDLMEAIFDAAYLTFDLIAGILFFARSEGMPKRTMTFIPENSLCVFCAHFIKHGTEE